MVSALDYGFSGLGSSTGRGHCVVFLGKTPKAGVNVKAALTSLNTAFLPISRSQFKRR